MRKIVNSQQESFLFFPDKNIDKSMEGEYSRKKEYREGYDVLFY